MSLLLPILPASWRPYAKAILAALGAVVAALILALPAVPDWLTVASSILTALGVYAQPNAADTSSVAASTAGD